MLQPVQAMALPCLSSAAFNAFSTPAQISPVTQTDLTVLQALGFQLNSPPAAVTTQPTSGLTNTQTTVQNTVNSPPGNSSGLDQQVALFNQYMAAGFPEQHC